MEESIGNFCGTLKKFSNHLQTSCAALKESVERRPIPLDSASTTFVQSVNGRVTAAGDDLNMLESMSFATVSFEELLGHCNEVLKKNHNDFFALQDHLRSTSDYIPPLDFDGEEPAGDGASDDISLDSSNESKKIYDKNSEEDSLFDDLSLKNFGISEVSLATIASQCDDGDANFGMNEPDSQIGETTADLNQNDDSTHLLNVSRDDYESLPKSVRGLVLWEDLLVAVEKVNSCIAAKKIKADKFGQDEIGLLELGYKARTYLLLLIKMNCLSIETNDGVISYRVL